MCYCVISQTSIALRFSQDNFGKSYNQTIGVDFFLKRMTFASTVLAVVSHLYCTFYLVFAHAISSAGMSCTSSVSSSVSVCHKSVFC